MASTTSSSDNADPSTALRKRKGSGHDDDDLDALESVSSSSTSVPASCKRPHLHSPHSTYQEGALKQLRELFGDRADVAMIESVYYDQCDEDTHRAIARLVAATGLHAELVQQQSGSQQQQWQQEEEKQQEAKTEEKANQRAAFVRLPSSSSPSSLPLPCAVYPSLLLTCCGVRVVERSGTWRWPVICSAARLTTRCATASAPTSPWARASPCRSRASSEGWRS